MGRQHAIAGTLGERYLTTVRSIPAPVEGWPDCIRWNPDKRAVIFAATTAEGEIEATQEILLTPDGQNKRRLDGTKIDSTRGTLGGGAAVRLPATSPALAAPLPHAEGGETGLSGWRATGLSTLIWLGGLARAKLPPGRRNILLCDDDAPGSPADRQIEKALDAWREDGIRVAVATPWPERRGDESDFNDLLRAEGIDAVRPSASPRLRRQGSPRPRHRSRCRPQVSPRYAVPSPVSSRTSCGIASTRTRRALWRPARRAAAKPRNSSPAFPTSSRRTSTWAARIG